LPPRSAARAFLGIEARVRAPLMPLGLFRLRSVATANVVGVLWGAAMFAWFFISALYLQLVLGYSAMQVGLAFLPANLIMAAFSLGLSARIVMRFGIRAPTRGGVAACGRRARAVRALAGRRRLRRPRAAGMVLLGVGAGMALNPLLLAAMSEVAPRDSGLASASSILVHDGGALGLASSRALPPPHGKSRRIGAALPAALTGGYHVASSSAPYSRRRPLCSAQRFFAPDPPRARREEAACSSGSERGLLPGRRPGATGATGFFGCLGFFFSRLLRC